MRCWWRTVLREAGVTQVTGDLRLQGYMTFDWLSDEDGSRLRRALAGSVSLRAALAAVRAFELESPTGPAPEKLLPTGIPLFSAARTPRPLQRGSGLLLIHRSEPLFAAGEVAE